MGRYFFAYCAVCHDRSLAVRRTDLHLIDSGNLEVTMTNSDKGALMADQVFAFVRHISQDEQILETLVELAGERGFETNVAVLREFFELSSGLASFELTDSELETVAGGLGVRTSYLKTAATLLGAAGYGAGMQGGLESSARQMKLAGKDGEIAGKQSKMTAD
jgi:hypothetical protein